MLGQKLAKQSWVNCSMPNQVGQHIYSFLYKPALATGLLSRSLQISPTHGLNPIGLMPLYQPTPLLKLVGSTSNGKMARNTKITKIMRLVGWKAKQESVFVLVKTCSLWTLKLHISTQQKKNVWTSNYQFFNFSH